MKLFNRLADKLREISSKRGFTCDCCGTEIFDYPQNRLCGACISALWKNEDMRCEKCGRQTVAYGICLDCKSRAPAFDRGVSPFVYRGKTAGLVNRIKNGERRLAYFFGEEASKTLLRDIPVLKTEEVLILPVPCGKTSLIERGYNQALDLARIIEKELTGQGLRAATDADALIKNRETKPQKQLHLFERTENVQGAFRVHKRTAVQDKTVLLIDDIMTTGATGSECARILKNAGAKTVYFLVMASLPEMK